VLKRPKLVGLAEILLPAVIVVLGVGTHAAEPDAQQKTQVIIFSPSIPSGQSKPGYCWTDSIGVSRRGAWRCMKENEIFDPCLQVPGLTKAVVCDANPASNQRGFVMKLTKPLPKPSSEPEVPRPWLLKLADGSVCEVETGTIAQVNGKDVPYDCSDSGKCDDNGNCARLTGVADSLQAGKLWRAEKLTYRATNGQIKLLKTQRMAVAKVWE
jgi:hypothetical protein